MDINKKEAQKKFGEFLTELGFDWENDDNMKDTPKRVVKMYSKEVFKGVYEEEPKTTSFENDGYEGMVFQGNIEIKSICSHHFCPFIGKCHIAYVPSKTGKVIGLSKLNRIADYYARRPQLQERLTQQIHDKVSEVCEGNLGVMVMVEAKHTCVSMRGIEHDSIMKTASVSGAFYDNDNNAKSEFLTFINNL